MKSTSRHRLIFILMAISTYGMIRAQTSGPLGQLLFQDTLTFDPLHEWISIPSPDENLWQVGIAQKNKLDSSYSGMPVMITDTINSYPAGADDYFYLSIPGDDVHPEWYSWAEGILSFRHRYDTDTLTDGGFIEISYDGGETWRNIIQDQNHVLIDFTGLYTSEDTITGGFPAFSGTSDGWVYTEFHWIWYALVKTTYVEPDGIPILRFRFISDETDTGKEGWLIDEIIFRGYSAYGAVEDKTGDQFAIFPNPCDDILNVEFLAMGFMPSFRIYSQDGKLLLEQTINGPESIEVSVLAPGVYFYSVLKGIDVLQRGKFVKI
jgi:hypothetical protein